jgi:hypothetical protein
MRYSYRLTAVLTAALMVGVLSTTGSTYAASGISFVAAASADGNSVALPDGWSPGDVAILHSVRVGSSSTPALPKGWTSVANNPGTNVSRRIGYRILQEGDTSTGVSSNATHVLVAIYRGVNPAKPIGASKGGPVRNTDMIALNSLTLQGGGKSWVVGLFAHDHATNTKSAVLGETTNRSSTLSSTFMGLVDTNGPVSSWRSAWSSPLNTLGERTNRSIELLPATSPTATPSVSPTPTTPAGTVLFQADAETGDATQWCFGHSAVPVGVASDQVRSGAYSYRSEIRDGQLIYDTERSEYSNGPKACSKHSFAPGDETWTAISYYLPPSFPYYSRWSLVAQWKEPYGGTPPQQINLQEDKWHIVGSNTLSPRPRWELAPIRRGQWEDFVVHHKWSTDPKVGFVEVYLNGKLVLPKTYTRTINNEVPLFLSVGHYRDLRNEGTAVLYIDDVKVGTTHDSVR